MTNMGGGDSDEDGEEANYHLIGLARRLIADNQDGMDDDCGEFLTKSTAEGLY